MVGQNKVKQSIVQTNHECAASPPITTNRKRTYELPPLKNNNQASRKQTKWAHEQPPLAETDPPTCLAKADSAASHHYWRPEDAMVLTNRRPAPETQVVLPNMETISSQEQGLLPLHASLSKQARQAKVLSGLGSASLISLG